ncbi:S-layer protein [Cytobacillus sp. SAFR-174]|uniref:S-layer protein n=1 Tax=Cytobacillus sp. SAFR-174 TaxID=3436868 RepID=UPI003F7CFAC2
MSKKKAIKLAAASAVAASAFVAAAPAQTDAASNVAVEVSKAVTQMKKAYHTYSDVTANGEFAPIADVYKEYNAAKAAYKNAKALVTKAGGEHKEAYLAQLDATYNEYIAKRVVTYIDAYNYATALEDKKEALEAALEEKEWDKAEELYHEISYELKTRTVILHRVYGQTARELLVDAFKLEAQDTRDSITNEVSVKMYFDKAEDLVAEGKLEDAKKAMDHVADYVAKLDKDTDFGAALLTKVSEVKAAYEAKLAPAVESVSAINAKELVVKFNLPLKESSVVETTGAGKGTLVDGTFKVDGAAADALEASLSADGKELTIRSATDWEGTHSVEVIADKLVSTSNKKVGHFTTAFNFDDTVRASITGVEYVNKYTYKVNFSEPVNAVGSESAKFADGSAVTLDTAATGYGLSADGKSFTVVFDSATTANKEITVSFPSITDFAGNISVPATAKATISDADKTKPTVASVVSASPTTVKVKFSETIKLVDATKVSYNGVALTAADVAVDANDKTVLNVTVPSTTTSGVLALAAGVVEDLNKNENGASSQTVSFAHDKVAPQVTASEVVKVSGVNNLKVTFSEAVTEVGTTLTLKYTDEYGVQKSIVVPAAKINVDSTDSKVVFIELHDGTSVIKEGVNYSVEIPTGFFVDGFNNNSVAKTVSFLNSTSSTTTKLALNTTNPIVNGIDAKGAYVDVQFADAVNASTATNTSNYAIEGATVSSAVLTYNNPTTANVDGAKAVVRVYIADNTVEATGNYNVTVNGVTGYSSSVTQMNSDTKNIAINENTRATVTSSTVKSLGASTVVAVTFSEAIASGAGDANDFDLFVDGVKVSTATVTGGAAAATIDFTINTDLSDELAAGKVVKLVATSTLDLADSNSNVADVKEIVIK